jgi:hypothetical protein
MAVRITKASETKKTVLLVDGYLNAEDVGEPARIYRSSQGSSGLELSNLRSADSAGVKCLQELILLGAEISGASPYIELLLKRTS